VMPAEEVLEAHAEGAQRWTIHPCMEELKAKVCVLHTACMQPVC